MNEERLNTDYVAVDEHGRMARDRLRTYIERLDAADAALWGGSIWTDDLWPYDEESGDLIGVTMVDDIRTLVHQCDLWVPLPATAQTDGSFTNKPFLVKEARACTYDD